MSAMPPIESLESGLNEVPDVALTFADLLKAAQRYEREMAPDFVDLCQREPQARQALLDKLSAGETRHQPALMALLDAPDAEILSQALLDTPLDVLTRMVARLRPMTLHTADEAGGTPDKDLPLRCLNLLEAHCFGSAPARAPAMLQDALLALEGPSLAPLQALVPDLPPAAELASWLGQADPDRLAELRDACHARLQAASGPDTALLGHWLTALNSMLLLRRD